MNSPATTPTLLIFTLGADRQARRSRLLPEPLRRVEERLHQACLDRAIEAGLASGCQIALAAPQPESGRQGVIWEPQAGGDFGERLERAVVAAQSRSGGPLVIVGSDVPELSARHVEEALVQLDEEPERVVVGPSPDGGIYLLAGRGPLAEIIAATRWCRATTCESLLAALAGAGRSVTLLEPIADLDRRADLERWLARHPERLASWRRLVRTLRQLLARLRRPWLAATSGPLRLASVPVPAVRGPPAPPRRR